MANELISLKARDIELGMFLHSMECSWINRPFWRNRFLISDQATLQQLRQYGDTVCWIDIKRGKRPSAAASEAPAPAQEPVAAPARQASAIEQSVQAFAGVQQRAAEASAQLFAELRFGSVFKDKEFIALATEVADASLASPHASLALLRLKNKDEYTHLHSVAVCALMANLAQAMGLPPDQVRQAGLAGLLHDIGKVAIPLDVLNKPGKLTDEEFVSVQRHPEKSYELLQGAEGIDDAIRKGCLYHHEKFAGGGYPHKLQGSLIPTLARMCAVCDVYDAITSDRPYKAGWDPAESISKMMSWRGHFDPEILATFVRALGIYPVGSLVRLRSQRLAAVIQQNPQDYTRPAVTLLYDLSKSEACEGEMNLQEVDDAIVASEERQNWRHLPIDDYWSKHLAAP